MSVEIRLVAGVTEELLRLLVEAAAVLDVVWWLEQRKCSRARWIPKGVHPLMVGMALSITKNSTGKVLPLGSLT